MVHMVVYLLAICVFVSGEKRIVLHSASDLAQELLNLRSEIAAFRTNVSSKISALETENAALKTKLISKAGLGSLFVRWGRTTCPRKEIKMIYKGYMAGGSRYDNGGGANQLCLPDHPTWGNYSDGLDGYKGYIYGVEMNMVEPSHVFGHAVNDQDLPCVVCQAEYALTHMFPGRIDCFPGWTLQYAGYLASSWHGSDTDHDYYCVDSDPEALAGGGADNDQSVAYLVEGRCGSLPCPPYVDGREIACSVCSK